MNQNVWLHSSLSSDSTRLTFDPIIEGVPVWSPREDKIAFFRGRGIMVTNAPKRNLGVAAGSNGGDEATVLVDAAGLNIPNDWSRDGRYFVYSRTPAYSSEAVRTQRDLLYLKCEDEAIGCEEVPFLQTPSDESLGQLSPDGRLIAYCSDESGRKEVYVRRFPQGADKWQVSFNGGAQPRWSRDGQEMFYVEEKTLIVVSVQTSPNFSVGSSERLFEYPNLKWNYPGHRYDVSADGRQFVLVEILGPTTPVIRVVENWFEDFRDQQRQSEP